MSDVTAGTCQIMIPTTVLLSLSYYSTGVCYIHFHSRIFQLSDFRAHVYQYTLLKLDSVSNLIIAHSTWICLANKFTWHKKNWMLFSNLVISVIW